MQSNSLVSIIILNYNAGELLLNCVESVFKTNYDNFEVIVVDNVSNDNSHKKCKEKFEKLILIENKKNYGYCEGNNIGIKNANGEFIVILNPDTIVEKEWLNNFIDAYNKNNDALYQPKILSLYEKNILQSTGNMIQLFGFGYAKNKGILDQHKSEEITEIGYASGTCLFTSKKMLDEIGLLDPFIFLYHDDLELGLRAAQLGFKSYYVPKSVIYHAESYSLKWGSKKFFWLERNRKYCLLTHLSKSTYHKMRFSLFFVDIMVWIFYISKGFLLAKIRAELDIKRNKDHILKKYNEIEQRKKIPDAEILKNFTDEIFLPKNVSRKITNKFFNLILSTLSKNMKKKIL
jgi:hypothetical protein